MPRAPHVAVDIEVVDETRTILAESWGASGEQADGRRQGTQAASDAQREVEGARIGWAEAERAPPGRSMPEILSVATALPPHTIDAAQMKARLPDIVAPDAVARFSEVVDASGIRSRHLVESVDDLFRFQEIQDRTAQYVKHVVPMAEDVARRALAAASMEPGPVDTLLSVSCTGHMMPSLEAHLVGLLGLSPRCRRVPLTELGCSGGVGALGLASELLRLSSTGTVLMTVVELCSLCLQAAEPSRMDVIGSLLFGDGAAGIVIGAGGHGEGPELVASGCALWADTCDQLGMRLTGTGLRLNLSPAVPRLVRKHLSAAVQGFLEAQGVGPERIRFWAIHPGGPKILEAVQSSLQLSDGAVRPSWEVWERCGNMSAATVFFILRHIAESAPPSQGDLGLMLAVGPGVTCEMVLLRWGRALKTGHFTRTL